MDEPVHVTHVSLSDHILNRSPTEFTECARNALAIPQASDKASAEVDSSLQPTFFGHSAAPPYTHAVLQMREHERLHQLSLCFARHTTLHSGESDQNAVTAAVDYSHMVLPRQISDIYCACAQ